MLRSLRYSFRSSNSSKMVSRRQVWPDCTSPEEVVAENPGIMCLPLTSHPTTSNNLLHDHVGVLDPEFGTTLAVNTKNNKEF